MGSLLGPLIQQAAQARSSYLGGQREGQERAKQDTIAAQLMARQQKKDAMADALQQAQEAKLRAETIKLGRPAVVAPRNIDPNSQEGIAAAIAKQQGIQGIKPTGTKAPLLGSAEYLKAQEELEKMRAGYRAAPPTSFSTVTLGGGEGQPPVVKTFDNKTGKTGETIGTAKPADNTQKITDTSKMTAAYVSRMTAASQTLDKMEADPKFLGSLSNIYGSPSGSGAIPYVGNLTMSPGSQVYRQAQQEWVRAKLRKESGATIPTDEMRREIETYFAQPKDAPEVVRSKAASRKVVEAALRTAAGRALAPAAPTPPPTGDSSTGDIDLTAAASAPSRAQQLWDAAVAKYGEPAVLKAGGKKPP